MIKYSLMAVSALLGLASFSSVAGSQSDVDFLIFDPHAYHIDSITMSTGEIVKFKVSRKVA